MHLTSSMKRYRICKPSTYCTIQDLLNFAPCPPPTLTYSEICEHALSRNLSHLEVCNIIKRCRPDATDVDEDCCFASSTTAVSTPVTDYSTVNVSRTPATTEAAINHTTDYSFHSSTSSTFSTEQTSHAPASSSINLIIIFSVICPVIFAVLSIVVWKIIKGRRKKNRVSSELQTRQDTKTPNDGEGINNESESRLTIQDKTCDVADITPTDENKNKVDITSKTGSNEINDDKCNMEYGTGTNKPSAFSNSLDSTDDGGGNFNNYQQQTTRL